MQYQARAAAVEAERVTLAGQEMAAVAVAGKVALVPADVFDVFFALREAVEGIKAVVKPSRVPEGKPTARLEPATPKREKLEGKRSQSPQARSEELRAIVLKALQECGPLTTAELGDRLYPQQTNAKLRGQGAWLITSKMAAEDLIEKQGYQWHLKAK